MQVSSPATVSKRQDGKLPAHMTTIDIVASWPRWQKHMAATWGRLHQAPLVSAMRPALRGLASA